MIKGVTLMSFAKIRNHVALILNNDSSKMHIDRLMEILTSQIHYNHFYLLEEQCTRTMVSSFMVI